MTELEKIRNKINAVDSKMAKLFIKRLKLAEQAGEAKKAAGLPIEDTDREKTVMEENLKGIEEEYRIFYKEFIKTNIRLSKAREHSLSGKRQLVIKPGAINVIEQFADLKRKVLIVTDTGVPKEHVGAVFVKAKEPFIFTFAEGENSKSFETVQNILSFMLQNGFDRGDCIVAVGGGVVGDIASFTASIFMRGIDYYCIPTTTLSQVDSCIGGKTGIDFGGAKNTVGSFMRPKCVIVDSKTLETLDKRDYVSGLIEAVKTGAILNEKLFRIFEKGNINTDIEEIIKLSLAEKLKIVTSDEKEKGTRRCLNFGHTVGHAIETVKGSLLHGECVAAGMLYCAGNEVKDRLLSIYKNLGITVPEITEEEKAKIKEIIKMDKKITGDTITAVFCEKIGSYTLKNMPVEEFFEAVGL